MTSSFATYASQFLNRQRSPNGAAPSSPDQPLFFSFSTEDGSQHGSGHLHRENRRDLDDGGDPHLRSSDDTAGLTSMADTRNEMPYDNDDPYLRLDEGDPGSLYPETFPPILGSSRAPSEQSRGWLAHQPTQLRSPSPSSSELDDGPIVLPPSKARQALTPSPPPPPPPISLSLTQSLLPRDGYTRPIDLFSLPDPRYISSRSRQKFHDPIWTSIWLTGLSTCVLSSLLSLFLTRKPSDAPRTFPYTTFLHTIPLLVILTFTSAAVSYAHILLLRVFVKPVVIGTSVFVPATLLISSIWAFSGSFMWDGEAVPTWGETWGYALPPLPSYNQITNISVQFTPFCTYPIRTCAHHGSAPPNIATEDPFNVINPHTYHSTTLITSPFAPFITHCAPCCSPCVHPFRDAYLSFTPRRIRGPSQFRIRVAFTRMGQLGDYCDNLALVLDMGGCTWYVACDDSCSYRSLVLCRVSLFLPCYGLTVFTVVDVPCMAALRHLRHLRWTHTAYMLPSIARYSRRWAA
jgi:hypothetical protein